MQIQIRAVVMTLTKKRRINPRTILVALRFLALVLHTLLSRAHTHTCCTLSRSFSSVLSRAQKKRLFWCFQFYVCAHNVLLTGVFLVLLLVVVFVLVLVFLLPHTHQPKHNLAANTCATHLTLGCCSSVITRQGHPPRSAAPRR